MTALILIVEDEEPQAELLQYNLQKVGYQTIIATNGELALTAIEEEQPHLVILDWMLPELSGIEVCRRIRSRSETKALPVIMITARGEENDKVRGLDVGADDYVVKPYSPRELVSRVQAVLRRVNPSLLADKLEFKDICLDINSHQVSRAGTLIHLGPKEFKILKTLLERPTRVLTREILLDRVWGTGVYVEDRTVDVHIGRLRKALKAVGKDDPIRTVRGVGYALNA
ncbi:MAG: phosphate regulon transcriptional regulator PhoB [Sneathiella sp.]